MYGMTSIVLFNTYRCACETLCQVIVTTLYPHVPLPPVSDHDEFQEGRRIYHLQCTGSKTRYTLQQHTFRQSKLPVGVDSWYTPLTLSCNAQLDTSIVKKTGPHIRIFRTR